MGSGRPAEIDVYDSKLSKVKKRFNPFDRKFSQGVNVTVGNFNGTGQYQIATVAVSNSRPLIRLFDSSGKKLREFYVSGIFGAQTITLGAADINTEGKDQILVMSSN